MLAASAHPRRWILAAALGLGGVLVGQLREQPAPPSEPEIICVIPDVTLARPAPAHRVVIADLLSRGSTMPDCGSLRVETRMVFADVNADSATLRVLVPCAELSRARYSKTAGDAPALRAQDRYRLELSAVAESLWRADRIDSVGERK